MPRKMIDISIPLHNEIVADPPLSRARCSSASRP
jgi:hypothetical protein